MSKQIKPLERIQTALNTIEADIAEMIATDIELEQEASEKSRLAVSVVAGLQAEVKELTEELKSEKVKTDHALSMMKEYRRQHQEALLKIKVLEDDRTPVQPTEVNLHYNINDGAVSIPVEMTGINWFVFMADGVDLIQRENHAVDILVSDLLDWLNNEMRFVREHFANASARLALEFYHQAYIMHEKHMVLLSEDPEQEIELNAAYLKAATDFTRARMHCRDDKDAKGIERKNVVPRRAPLP